LLLIYSILINIQTRTLPHVNPLPKAERSTKSPLLIFPCSIASLKAIGIEAAVVFPYFWILLKILSSGNPNFAAQTEQFSDWPDVG
jgi:hypothetical protein